MTPAQLATLKAYVLADQTASALYANGEDGAVADWCNEVLPSFIVWRSKVSTSEIGKAVNYVAVEAMTDVNRGRINTFYGMNPVSFDPSRADIRTYWANTFSGALGGQGQATRDALEALWRRAATRAESALATGTGTTASPAALGLEVKVSDDDIANLRSL